MNRQLRAEVNIRLGRVESELLSCRANVYPCLHLDDVRHRLVRYLLSPFVSQRGKAADLICLPAVPAGIRTNVNGAKLPIIGLLFFRL